ncbi:MAG: hypothetical protein V4689_09470 [Verrucomicrobiota bacterium]
MTVSIIMHAVLLATGLVLTFQIGENTSPFDTKGLIWKISGNTAFTDI